MATEKTTPRRARTKATAAHFHISVMTLWRWTKLQGFPQPLKMGRVVLYDLDAIEEWMMNGEGEK